MVPGAPAPPTPLRDDEVDGCRSSNGHLGWERRAPRNRNTECASNLAQVESVDGACTTRGLRSRADFIRDARAVPEIFAGGSAWQ